MELFDKLYAGAKWDVGVAIDRSNALPLDRNAIFPSYDLAVAYAAMDEVAMAAELTKLGIDTKINNNAYAGQVLAVVTETETSIYYIDANKQLQEVGGKIGTDGKSITADSDGNLFVYGFEGADSGTLPQKWPVYKEGSETEVDHYELRWVPIADIIQLDGNTVTEVSAGDSSVVVTKTTDTDEKKAYTVKIKISEQVNNAVTVDAHPVLGGLFVAQYDDTEVRNLISANTTKFNDYYTSEQTDTKISEAIVAAGHTSAKVVFSVDTTNNTYIETEGGTAKTAVANVIYYVKDDENLGSDVYKEYLVVGGKLTLVGDTSTDLSNYYTSSEIDTKVEALESSIEDAKKAGTDASDALNTYKGEVAAALETKANKETTYTKTEVDTKLEGYATTTALTEGLAGKANNDTVTGIGNRVTTLEADNTTNKTNIQNNATAISEHATEFATFKGTVETKQEGYDTAIKALQDKDVLIDESISNLSKADETHDNKIAALEQADGTLGDDIAAVSIRVNAVETVLNGDGTDANIGISARVDNVETVAANAATTASNAEAKVNSLQEQFDELVSEGGEPNTISTLQVNGTSISPVNKVANVVIEVSGQNSVVDTVADASSGKVTATISRISTDIFVQGKDTLVLDGGNA